MFFIFGIGHPKTESLLPFKHIYINFPITEIVCNETFDVLSKCN